MLDPLFTISKTQTLMIPVVPRTRQASMPSPGSNSLQIYPNSQAFQKNSCSEFRDEFLSENFDYEDPEYAATLALAKQITEKVDNLRCWICFGDDQDSAGIWVNPCHCSLVSHEECLLAWINENQKGQSKKEVSCPQCNEPYKVTDPPSLMVDVFAKIDELIQAAVPYFFLTGLAGSVLVTSTTYGAYAVLTVCGLEEGEHILGSPNPWTWRVWVGLPMIPWVLIMSRGTLLDTVMPLLPVMVLGNDPIRLEMPPSPRLIVSILPWIRLFYNTAWNGIFGRLERSWREQNNSGLDAELHTLPTPAINGNIADQEWDDDPLDNQQADALDPAAYIFMERRDLARTVVGALLLPAISSVAGNLISYIPFIRNRLPNTFIRSIIGGCLFVFLKDITNLLYKYHLVCRLRNRHVKSVKPRKK